MSDWLCFVIFLECIRVSMLLRKQALDFIAPDKQILVSKYWYFVSADLKLAGAPQHTVCCLSCFTSFIFLYIHLSFKVNI